MEGKLVPSELKFQLLQKFAGFTKEESETLVGILNQPTPVEWIRQRPARGGDMVPYVAGPYFIQRFNEAFGFLWSYEVPEHFEKDGQIVARGRWTLKIPGRTIIREHPDGTKETIRFDGFEVVKEQFGSSEVKKYAKTVMDKKGTLLHKAGDIIDLGDDYKGAGTDAMKKCGTELGMFYDVYAPRETKEESGMTQSQFDTLHWRGEEAGMSQEQVDKWVEEQLGKPLSECENIEVLGLIPKLIQMTKGKEGG